MILYGKADDNLNEIEITSPKNIIINMPVKMIHKDEKSVQCEIIKFSGDDPDITNGIEIRAEVRKIAEDEEIVHELHDYDEIENAECIYLKAGIGIGKITKEGLFEPKGEPAINPVPSHWLNPARTHPIPIPVTTTANSARVIRPSSNAGYTGLAPSLKFEIPLWESKDAQAQTRINTIALKVSENSNTIFFPP